MAFLERMIFIVIFIVTACTRKQYHYDLRKIFIMIAKRKLGSSIVFLTSVPL
tara:strand:+ start:365 stop:520 length:156 start_codon:yes stop_codon:yes gene_type:complete